MGEETKNLMSKRLWDIKRIEIFFLYGLNNEKIKFKSLIWTLGGHVYAGYITILNLRKLDS